MRIVPRQIDAVETWVASQLQLPGVPPEEEILARFVEPLLAQIRIDAAPQIVSLAENRLGIHAPLTSVRQVARNMGLTRARVYQLLNEINDIMSVRWPSGRQQVYQLDAKFRAELRGAWSSPCSSSSSKPRPSSSIRGAAAGPRACWSGWTDRTLWATPARRRTETIRCWTKPRPRQSALTRT